MVNVKIKKIDQKANIDLPKYMTEHASGMDIRACLDQPYLLKKGQVGLISTGLSVAIPENYEIQVRPRSGLAAKHGIGVLNSPGTIDADYRGEVKVILFNFSDQDFEIQHGDRIAQIVIAKVEKMNFLEVESLNETDRNAGGFGHTGV